MEYKITLHDVSSRVEVAGRAVRTGHEVVRASSLMIPGTRLEKTSSGNCDSERYQIAIALRFDRNHSCTSSASKAQ